MSSTKQRHIIWQSADQDITLIDIPVSISSAQRTDNHQVSDSLLSTKPQEQPYQTNEPKSAAARTKLVNNTVDSELHEEYVNILGDALARIREAHDRPWCLTRRFGDTPVKDGNKRSLNVEDDHYNPNHDGDKSSGNAGRSSFRELPSDFLPSLSRTSFAQVHGVNSDETTEQYAEDPPSQSEEEQNSRMRLSVVHPDDHEISFIFLIPPRSSFILGPCSDPQTLHRSVRAQAQELETPKTFDLVILDPPWPNRSVKRTHKTANSTYSTVATLDGVYELIMGMDLDVLMANSCLVAIWITNKLAIRELVLGEQGLFDCWGVELVEEWLWLKTTLHGEPVTPINSVWRKPYEVLLVGRMRRQYIQPSEETLPEHGQVKQRVLASVPDLHSRKPCLKDLLEPLVRSSGDYRALEVFARHLIADWWSWGDECIKFNWDGYWGGEAQTKEDTAVDVGQEGHEQCQSRFPHTRR